MAIGERIGIIRFCETPKDKGRIMSRLGLNDVQAESHLAILTRQSMLIQNNGKYVVTIKGQSYISSSDRVKKNQSLSLGNAASNISWYSLYQLGVQY